MRPVRAALAADTVIGDDLPRSRPTFGGGSTLQCWAHCSGFTVIGAMLGIVWDPAGKFPVPFVLIGCVAIGINSRSPSAASCHRPCDRFFRDLASGTDDVSQLVTTHCGASGPGR